MRSRQLVWDSFISSTPLFWGYHKFVGVGRDSNINITVFDAVC